MSTLQLSEHLGYDEFINACARKALIDPKLVDKTEETVRNVVRDELRSLNAGFQEVLAPALEIVVGNRLRKMTYNIHSAVSRAFPEQTAEPHVDESAPQAHEEFTVDPLVRQFSITALCTQLREMGHPQSAKLIQIIEENKIDLSVVFTMASSTEEITAYGISKDDLAALRAAFLRLDASLKQSPEAFGLNVLSRRRCAALGIDTVGKLIQHTADDLTGEKGSGFGTSTLAHVREKLTQAGLALQGDL